VQHRTPGRYHLKGEGLVGLQFRGQVVVTSTGGIEVDQLNLINLVPLEQTVGVGAADAGNRKAGGRAE
jgi:hypothetical protein